MDWTYTNPQIDRVITSLGGVRGDDYVMSNKAIEILNEINCKLMCDDKTLRTFRRAIGKKVKSDLLPFLTNVKDYQMIDQTIRILMNLTIPVECLFSVEVMMRTEVGRSTIEDLNASLAISKDSFTDVRAMRAVVDHIKYILEKDTKLSLDQCDSVNNCLLLLRNILHVPEMMMNASRAQTNTTCMQNQVIWNLFTLSIDKLFIYLMSCPQRSFWSVTMVQLIALMYKDQHVAKLQKLLNIWFDDSLSDSSEDFESDTSPPNDNNGDSSPMLTMSDSSDNAESVSTSSTDSPKNQQKSPMNQQQLFNATNNINGRREICAQEQKELRRKKLVKRSKCSSINMKGLPHHSPTDDDISNILKEFTVDFLLKSYGYLVEELHTKLLSEMDSQAQIDTSHFFWLVTYFLKFAAQLELDLDHIKNVLSFNIVSYLAYEGVSLFEQLELTSRRQDIDVRPNQRRMHLLVTAIREFLLALETYKKITHLNTDDVNYIGFLQLQISATEDLKHLFILLIRNYNPKMQSRQYLQDLIVTNHILMLVPSGLTQQPDAERHHRLKEHVEQFASADIMQQYGLLLENFRDNGEYVNDCIFTMMHHIGGDLDQVTALFQPTIIKTYSRMWEIDYELCDDWCDLIQYVIYQFINTPQKMRLKVMPTLIDSEMSLSSQNSIDGFCDDVWSKEEIDILFWYYEQSKSNADCVGEIVKLFTRSGFKSKSRIALVQQLLQQDIVNRVEYNELMKFENAEYERTFKLMSLTATATADSCVALTDKIDIPTDDIQVLKEKLLKENKGKLINWLQSILLECCFAKLCCLDDRFPVYDPNDENPKVTIVEPVPHHCILKKQSVPVVPWNAEQNSILLYQPFILLLHKLGFQLPADSGKLFVRIPACWTADVMLNVAEKLGPLDRSTLKFSWTEFTSEDVNRYGEHSAIPSKFIAFPQQKAANCSPPSSNWMEDMMLTRPRVSSFQYPQSSTAAAVASSLLSTATTTTSSMTTTVTHDIQSNDKAEFRLPSPHSSSINMDIDPDSNPISDTVQRANGENENAEDANSDNDDDDDSDAASVTSNLTRMCVSDDEEQSFETHRSAMLSDHI